MTKTLSYAAGEIRRFDRDRFVTVLFAPDDRREALFTLYAFNLEVARIRELVSEATLGEIRLQWWRDTLETLFNAGHVAHPLAEDLGKIIRQYGLSRFLFERLLDSRIFDLQNSPPANLADLENYADGTVGTLQQLALEILGVSEDAAFRAARHVGIAWALTGLLRAVPFHAAAGRLYLPADQLAEQRLEIDEILAGHSSPALGLLARSLAGRATYHLTRARDFPS